MRYTTTDGRVYYDPPACRCGLTGGCSQCRNTIFGFKLETRDWMEENEWGFLPSTKEDGEFSEEEERKIYDEVLGRK